VVESGESCDDGNTLSCGTCDADCENEQLAPATGSIEAASRGQLEEADDTFTIDDGVNTPVVFAFDTGGGSGCELDTADVCVDVRTATRVRDVADAIADAINTLGAGLLITAEVSGSTVTLTHDRDGVAGNQELVEEVGAQTFAVEGMSGGLGFDCEAGTNCAAAEDCASGTCSDGVCE
jgi:phage tail sheath gpL-like